MRDYCEAGLALVTNLVQHLLEHIEVQLVYETGVLERGNKVGRRKEPALRVNPARQRLLVAHPSAYRAHDGLVVYLNPVLIDGLVQMAHNMAQELELSYHALVEEAASREVRPTAPVAGVLGTVARNANAHVLKLVTVYANAYGKAVAAVYALAVLEDGVDPFHEVRVVGKDGKLVLSEATRAPDAKMPRQHVGCLAY